jgi:8-oxo-dGTP pyrophosphatase MutT (NUDIX family)
MKVTQERVRAVIIESENITLVKRVRDGKTYYVFPGGGVEEGEDKIEAMVREGKEELGVDLEVGELLMERQVDSKGVLQAEYFYLCKKIGGMLGMGTGPEYREGSGYKGSYEAVEIPLSEVQRIDLVPSEVKDFVLKKFSF